MKKQATEQATEQVTELATYQKWHFGYDMMYFTSTPSEDDIQEVYTRIQKILKFATINTTGNDSLSELTIELNFTKTKESVTLDELEIRKLLGIENNPGVSSYIWDHGISISDLTYRPAEYDED